MAYSLDFRQLVFKIKKKEILTFQELSARFDISIRTLFRWQKRIAPKRNKPSTKINMDALFEDVKPNPDHYQYERAKTFGVSQSAICYALKHLNFSNKKKHFFILNQIGCQGLYFNLKFFNMSL